MALSSLFGKKKNTTKEADKNSSSSVRPSLAEDFLPPPFSAEQYAENAKKMARATTDKIDRIESEMMSDQARSADQGKAKAANNSHITGKANSVDGAAVVNKKPPAATTFIGMGTNTPSVGQSTDILLGDSMLSNAIELSDSISNPAIEESAILFAYGQGTAAAEVLHESIQPGQSNHDHLAAWLMLLELYQANQNKSAFESVAIDYALRFESSAPPWLEHSPRESAKRTQPPLAASSAADQNVIIFSGPLDMSIVPQLDRLKRLTPKYHTLHVDFSGITRVETSGAELVLRMLTAFGKSNHALVVQGAELLLDKTLAAVTASLGLAPKPLWALLLDLYRLLDRQAEFEQKSMDYCLAYEVSPPSWETYSANIRPNVNTVMPMDAETVPFLNTELPPDTIALSGELLGKAENDLSLLTNFANGLDRVCIDCRALKRVDFTAGGALLNWAMSMQAANKTIEFKKVSHLVGALFVVMGLNEVAQIERRD